MFDFLSKNKPEAAQHSFTLNDAQHNDDLTRLQQYETVLDTIPIATMLCDRKTAIITYANKASLALIKNIEDLIPVTAEEIVGSSIDVFHKKPEYQRGIILSDSNLPHQAKVTLGGEILALDLRPLYSPNGDYTHVVLTWSIETEKARFEREIERFRQMVDKMPINVMMCDPENLEMVYMNDASIQTLRQLEHLLPVKADDIIGKSIDIFHKHPEHQRAILKDPSNLPHRARIKLGDETLDLNINAIMGQKGEYMAILTTWQVITNQVSVEQAVQSGVNTLNTETDTLNQRCDSMMKSAEQNVEVATTVSAAAEQATANVETMASATEELGASVNEISQQINRASTISTQAYEKTSEAETQVESLSNSSQKIGEIVKLINDIAEQTNLLALNATIEAARAGEAGRGFAVVASEVKSLANQTAKATEDITAQIDDVQNETTKVVSIITEVSKVIREVTDIASSIASAAEQQRAATTEIARSAQEAALGTQEVSNRIQVVQQTSNDTTHNIHSITDIAGKLNGLVKVLGDEADKLIKG